MSEIDREKLREALDYWDKATDPKGDKRALIFAAARAYLDGKSVPRGWQLVPIKPTQEMEDAHFKAHARAETFFASVPEIWAAMLAAAPKSEA